MKKFILAFALLIGVTSFCSTVEAQNINVSINIGRQPAWGPVGYDYAGYYYFPDIDIYYDVNVGFFHYYDRGRWVTSRYLSYAYRNYDLYRLYKVVLNVHQPWRNHHYYCNHYAKYRGHRSPVVTRDSRDHRYRDSRNNRVVWYSDRKAPNNRDYNRHNDKRYSDNKKVNNNHNRDNNYRHDNKKNDRSDKNYRAGRDNNKSNNNNNSRQDRNRSDKNYSSSKNSGKDNSKNNRVRRSSSSQSSNYRLASNSERGGRTR